MAAYEGALTAWLKHRCPDLGDTLALDGKTLRGSASYQVPGVHLLSAYAPHVAFITYHRRRSLPLRSEQLERELVAAFISLGQTDIGLPEDEERFLRECFANPDGWEEEVRRTLDGISRGSWTPPQHLSNWPQGL